MPQDVCIGTSSLEKIACDSAQNTSKVFTMVIHEVPAVLRSSRTLAVRSSGAAIHARKKTCRRDVNGW